MHHVLLKETTLEKELSSSPVDQSFPGLYALSLSMIKIAGTTVNEKQNKDRKTFAVTNINDEISSF